MGTNNTSDTNTTPDTNNTPRILHSVKYFHLREKDAVVWDDGSMTINDYAYEGEQDAEHDHACFTNSQARKLRKILNTPSVRQALGIAPRTPHEPQQANEAPTHHIATTTLSKRLEVATWANGEVTLEHPSFQWNNSLPHVCMDEEEAYKLYSVLHAHFLERER